MKEKQKDLRIFNKYEYSVFILYLFIQLKRNLQKRLKIANGKSIDGHQIPRHNRYVEYKL